jgi:diguanylate cyclase (GGDEF)-like protein
MKRKPDEITRVVPARVLTDHGRKDSECLVEIYGANLGKRYLLAASPILIGRGLESDIAVSSDAVSRRHALLEKRPQGWTALDLESTNGTWINDRPVKEALLQNGDLVKIGDTIFKFLSGSRIEGQYFEEIYRIMVFDGLTGVYNRRFLNELLEREFSRARRHGRNLSVLFIDLDNFKEINDKYGHLAGDLVLKSVARQFADRLRKEEVVGRYGGDEFVIVVPESAPEAVRGFAERVKEAIGLLVVEFEGQPIHITVSVGISMLANDMNDYEELLKRADTRLFDAKRAGKNQIMD